MTPTLPIRNGLPGLPAPFTYLKTLPQTLHTCKTHIPNLPLICPAPHSAHQDMVSLGCLPPTAEPKATDFIPQMITTIERIIANGHAYALPGGDVFFEVGTLPGYGCLSGRSQDDNRWGGMVMVGEWHGKNIRGD